VFRGMRTAWAEAWVRCQCQWAACLCVRGLSPRAEEAIERVSKFTPVNVHGVRSPRLDACSW